ncbi:MAG: hypothetical protein JNL60_06750 [Bacteroidia bacterium]|nr:hypothetical protein [Bacteroidia bacterium]
MKQGSIVLSFLFLMNQLQAQEPVPPKRFASYGIQFGTLGWASSFVQPDQGSVVMARTMNRGIAKMDQKRNGARYTLSANASLGVHASFSRQTNTKDLLSFGVGLFLNRSSYSFTLPYTIVQNGIALKNWHENNTYLAVLPSLRYSWLNGSGNDKKYPGYTYFGIAAGLSTLHTNFMKTANKGLKEEYLVNGNGVKTEYLAARNTAIMLGAEVGQRFAVKNGKNSLELGLTYFWSPENTYVKHMDFYSGGYRIGGTRVDLKGSMVTLSCRYSFNRILKKHALDTAGDVQELPKFQLMSLNGRAVDVQQVITVNNPQIDFYIWDDTQLDRDFISIYHNTDLILKGYELTRTKKKITLDLVPGANYFTIQAVDLGTTPPVVTAVRVYKNEIPKNRRLVSDFQNSASWKIIYKPAKP